MSAEFEDPALDGLKRDFEELAQHGLGGDGPMNADDRNTLLARFGAIVELFDVGLHREAFVTALCCFSPRAFLDRWCMRRLEEQQLDGICLLEEFYDPNEGAYNDSEMKGVSVFELNEAAISDSEVEFSDPDNDVFHDIINKTMPVLLKDHSFLFTLPVDEFTTSTRLRGEVSKEKMKHPSQVVLLSHALGGTPKRLVFNKPVMHLACVLYDEQQLWTDRLPDLPLHRIRSFIENLAKRPMSTSPDKRWSGTAEFADIFDIVYSVLVPGVQRGARDVVKDVDQVMQVLQSAMKQPKPTPASVLKELCDKW